MLPQATIITVVDTKDGSSPPPSSGLDLLFAAASQRQQPKTPGRAVTDCGSTISSLSSEVDVPQTPPPTKTFFPEVLMEMLNNNQCFGHIFSWKPDGKSFVIKSRHEFKENVLPLYFKSNFDSFLRKLKRWGFEKDKVNRRGDPSIEFSHRYFRRDESGLCLRMRCKSGPGRMADDSCNIQEDPQEVMRSSQVMRTSPAHEDAMRHKVALVDQLMNQQAIQNRLLEEINQAAIAEKMAALNAGRRDRTYDQSLITDRLRDINQAQLLMKKQMIVAAKKAQLSDRLSEYMAAPHLEQERTMNETHQGYQHLSQLQLQRLGQILDVNALNDDAIARYYRPMSGSLRTQHSREALRASILAKRQELGLSQPQQTNLRMPFAPSQF